MTAGRTVSVIFCDDVRQELNNKSSLIGCYQDELLVDQLPVVLPKFAAYVRVGTPADHPFRALAIRVLFADELLAELQMPMPERRRKFGKADRQHLSATGVVVMAPLALPGPGTLRVEVETEDGVLHAPSLIVREGVADAASP